MEVVQLITRQLEGTFQQEVKRQLDDFKKIEENKWNNLFRERLPLLERRLEDVAALRGELEGERNRRRESEEILQDSLDRLNDDIVQLTFRVIDLEMNSKKDQYTINGLREDNRTLLHKLSLATGQGAKEGRDGISAYDTAHKLGQEQSSKETGLTLNEGHNKNQDNLGHSATAGNNNKASGDPRIQAAHNRNEMTNKRLEPSIELGPYPNLSAPTTVQIGIQRNQLPTNITGQPRHFIPVQVLRSSNHGIPPWTSVMNAVHSVRGSPPINAILSQSNAYRNQNQNDVTGAPPTSATSQFNDVGFGRVATALYPAYRPNIPGAAQGGYHPLPSARPASQTTPSVMFSPPPPAVRPFARPPGSNTYLAPVPVRSPVAATTAHSYGMATLPNQSSFPFVRSTDPGSQAIIMPLQTSGWSREPATCSEPARRAPSQTASSNTQNNFAPVITSVQSLTMENTAQVMEPYKNSETPPGLHPVPLPNPAHHSQAQTPVSRVSTAPSGFTVKHAKRTKTGRYLPFLCRCGMEFATEPILEGHISQENTVDELVGTSFKEPFIPKSRKQPTKKASPVPGPEKTKKKIDLPLPPPAASTSSSYSTLSQNLAGRKTTNKIKIQASAASVISRAVSAIQKKNRHKEDPSGKMRCICGVGFKNNVSFYDHLRYHTGKSLLACKSCGKRFVYASLLKAHMKEDHNLGYKLHRKTWQFDSRGDKPTSSKNTRKPSGKGKLKLRRVKPSADNAAGKDTGSRNDDEPEIWQRVEVDSDPKRKYCICNKVSSGRMVGCDNWDCRMEWFHYECVGLSDDWDSKRKWFCPQCLPIKREAFSVAGSMVSNMDVR